MNEGTEPEPGLRCRCNFSQCFPSDFQGCKSSHGSLTMENQALDTVKARKGNEWGG